MTFPSLSQVQYETVRQSILNASVFVCSGNSAIDTLIKRGTASDFSHCGLLFWWGSRLMVMESILPYGVRSVPFSNYFRNYDHTGKPFDGRVLVGEAVGLSADPLAPYHVKNSATAFLGYEYDKGEIMDIIANLAIGLTSYQRHPGALICSEYVAIALGAGGFHIPPESNGFWFPSTIASAITPKWEVIP